MNKIWKQIPELHGYEASNFGDIKSIDRYVIYSNGIKRFYPGKILNFKNKICGAGYYTFKAHKKSHLVHRCVYSAFFGKIPKNKSINHKDFNKLNNEIGNLEMLTFSEQIQHAIKGGRFIEHCKKMSAKSSGVNNPRNKLSKDQALEIYTRLMAGEFGTALAKEFNVTPPAIYRLKKYQWFLEL